MLNKEIKRKIDNSRDILVGQLPLPSDQVELITIALIYKFMDDIDEESRKLGGEISFFKNGLSDFSWQKLLSNQLSGEERVQKFIQAVESITRAPHIAELFKSIFRNTFLKFRDPRVLKLFLDEINGFSYSHSEELGNAFEYLLNSMGSQGENGQFRTPRNIIDFIVEVVDPDKEDKILDPACGTAGFLISAYKHILRKYTKGYEDYRISLKNYEIEGISIHWGDKLSVIDKDKLTKRIEGYDITPLMVRLSQVNMYLHHFPNPLIHEYDTLSNKNRWNDKYDCIFANPPFMTPKGGIETHDNFRIRASKAEVLFSDYIVEHLTPNGKAGWIVPEGIIFQNSNDYVELRKWLIETMGLWAVVSLPAGIFQPYSGVKTSIIFVDRALARNTDSIILAKIENDGFSLNTNRNPIKDNDLPDALNLLIEYKGLANNQFDRLKEPQKKIEELSSKYPVKFKVLNRKEFAKLDSYKSVSSTIDYCKREFKKFLKAKENYEESCKKADNENQKQRAINTLQKSKEHFIENTGFSTIPFDESTIKEGVNEVLKEQVIKYGEDRSNLVLLPAELQKYLDDQRDFNLSIEKYSKKSEIRSDFDLIRMAEICEFIRGPFGGSLKKEIFVEAGYKVYEQKHAIQNDFNIGSYFISEEKFKEMKRFELKSGELIMSCSGTFGKVAMFPEHAKPGIINQALLKLIPNRKIIEPRYLVMLIESENFQKQLNQGAIGVAIQNVVSVEEIKSFLIPLPPLDIQQKIVEEIEGYQKVIDGCNLVIDNYKPSFKIDESWERVKLGELLLDIQNGVNFSKEQFGTGIPFVNIKDIFNSIGTVTIESLERINISAKEIERYKLKNDDLLFVRSSVKLEGIGFPSLIKLDEEQEIVFCGFIIKGTLNSSLVIPEYILFLLRTDKYRSYVIELSNRANITNISQDSLISIDIPLPHLMVQQQIVKTIKQEISFVENCKHLKTQMELKIKEVIDGVWGKKINDKEIQNISVTDIRS